jgi:hypothetical protein
MMDRDERDLVRTSMRQLVTTAPAAELPAQLLEGGWAELLSDEPATAVSVLAEEQGRAVAAAPTLDLVLLHGAGLPLDAATVFVLPPMRRNPAAAAAAEANGVLRVDGLVLPGHRRAETFMVPTTDGLVAVPSTALDLVAVNGGDPELGLHRATGDIPCADADRVAPAATWQSAMAAGRLALAAELVGLAERMLADTITYVLDRHQFGRPVASFQTVKHRLADVRVSIGATRSALATAWADNDPVSAMACKALAGRTHRIAATNCHQVHGGIAFTAEHGFHRLIRRGQVLDGLLGASNDLVRELGRHLIDTGRVPRTPQLGTQLVWW